MNLFLIAIAGFLLFILYKLLVKKRSEKLQETFLNNFLKPKTAFQESVEIDNPVSFGYKNLWFAVKVENKNEVAEMLNFRILGRANWENGVKQAYDNRIFITPEIEGWTLIVGDGLLPLIDKDSADINICNKLSLKYGEAHFFYTHRVTEYHIWAKSITGNLIRYYSYIGEQGENLKIAGEPTSIEKGLKLINSFSDEAKQENYYEDEKLTFPNESLVMDIANSWSINPSELENYKDIKKEMGIVCEIK